MECEGISLAFQDVAVKPKVGQLYAFSIAPVTESVQLLVPKCKWVPLAEHALPWHACWWWTFSHAVNKAFRVWRHHSGSR